MVILRSVLVGIASVVVAEFAYVLALFVLLAAESGLQNGEAGWDLESLIYLPFALPIVPLLVFALGFALGFRHFHRSIPAK